VTVRLNFRRRQSQPSRGGTRSRPRLLALNAQKSSFFARRHPNRISDFRLARSFIAQKILLF
jgi:hypothetical protein